MAEKYLQDQAAQSTTPPSLTIQEDSDEELGLPPSNYAADKVSKLLLPIGLTLLGKKASANCILRTGPLKFYVHVPMLASRSPTFRGIFDEMIEKGAWGPRDDGSSDGGSDGCGDDSDMDTNDAQHEGPSDQEMQESEDSDEEMSDSGSDEDEDEDDDDDDDDEAEDGDEDEDDMPVLNIDLADPVGSCFEELLRWV
ncbi:hypothetical protein BGX26_011386, partial [Mortierella sp. AD094]